MTERQRLLNEQNSNSRYYQRCHNKLSYLTQQEKTQFEKLKKAWKEHDLKTVSQVAGNLDYTRREIKTWQRSLIEVKGKIKLVKKQLKAMPAELDEVYTDQAQLNWEMQILKHGKLKELSDRLDSAKKELRSAIKAKDYLAINTCSMAALKAKQEFDNAKIKLKDIRRQMKANHGTIGLIKMNREV